MIKTSLKSYGARTDKSMRTVVRLEKTHNKIFAKTLNYLSKNNLTFNQFKVLEVLYHRGDLSIGDITKLTMSTPGNITVVVRNLKRDGYITSIKDLNDNRSTIQSITQKGIDIIEDIFPEHAENLHKTCEVLSDEELNTLYDLLNKLYKAN